MGALLQFMDKPLQSEKNCKRRKEQAFIAVSISSIMHPNNEWQINIGL